jgi:hypothetical protein
MPGAVRAAGTSGAAVATTVIAPTKREPNDRPPNTRVIAASNCGASDIPRLRGVPRPLRHAALARIPAARAEFSALPVPRGGCTALDDSLRLGSNLHSLA